MELARATPWYATWWQRAATAIGRVLGTLDLGADYRAGTPTHASYEPSASLSAMAAFPWVYAAMMRASGDLAGLRLRGYQVRGSKTTELPATHPLMRILTRPHPKWTGRQLRRQLYVDLRLTGNGFVTRLGIGQASTLLRLHPQRVEIQSDAAAGFGDYLYNGTGNRQIIPADQIYHVRTPSWQDDPRGLWGTGAIESLHDDLTTDRRAAKAGSALAKRPRPDVIVSPAGQGEVLTGTVREEISKKLDKLLGDGGTLVLPSNLKVDMPTWSPRDLEFPKLRELVREAILAVTGVPPHIVGLPVANYAQSKEQTLAYWELQQSIAADLEDAFLNPLAASFGEDLILVHDFSKVDALQESRTSRLARVQSWWAMGFDPVVMARYEGFQDLPENAVPTPAAGNDATPPAGKSVPTTRAMTEAERAAAWSSWIERAQAPRERSFASALQLALRAQASRVSARAAELDKSIEALGERRDLIDVLLAQLWDDLVEDTALAAAAKPQVLGALRAGWQSGIGSLGLTAGWDGTRGDPIVNAKVAELVTRVNATTKAVVRRIVLDALQEGQSMNDLQARLQGAAAFAPARALAIARTESTKSLNAGTLLAYQDGEAAGVPLKKQWLSARDGSVRDAHMALDGQERHVGEDFVVPAGAPYGGSTASAPGAFAEAALCVNCRCTLLPLLE